VKSKKEATRILIHSMTGRKPYKLSIHGHQMFSDKVLRKNALLLDKKKLYTLFPPNFIHSMDASLVHAFMVRSLQLNKILNQHDIYMSEITTHDNFTLGRFLFPILPYILKELYFELYHANYLATLKNNLLEEDFNKILSLCKRPEDPNYLSTPFENPNFIKYG
jgi:DNA-directed RNA polymerase